MKNMFESRKLPYVAYLTITVAVVASLTYAIENQIPQNVVAQNESADSPRAVVQAANVTGDLTQASGGNVFGGQETGEITIKSDGRQMDISGLISASPGEGKVYEAWLEDAGGSGYRLSLGQVPENGTIQFSQNMVNPFTYTIFYISEEPENDADPNPADAIAGIELEAPFGQ
jgi:hypothetical protein